MVKSGLPLVSCCLATYGRPPDRKFLIEEAIESYLRQSYPNKELVILNDCPGQQLELQIPGVRVFNVDARYPTLGDKRNAVVELCKGELLAVWDDDDISLPWRLSYSVEHMGEYEYYCPAFSWYQDREFLYTDVHIIASGALSIYRRDAFDAVGGTHQSTWGSTGPWKKR